VPRAHPAAHWNIAIDRQQSIVKAREISGAFGVNTSSWTAIVDTSTDSHRGFYARTHPDDAAAKRFTPIYPKIALTAPGGSDRVFVELGANGAINQWQRKGYPKSGAVDVAQARSIAENALHRIVGSDAAAFQQVTDAASSGTGLAFAWERSGGFTERFEATVDGPQLAKAELKPVYNSGLEKQRNALKHYRNVFDVIGVLLPFMAGVALCVWIYIYWAVRRAVRHRFVFALTGLVVLWCVINWFNWFQQDQLFDALQSGESHFKIWLVGGLFLASLWLLYLVVCGAMDAVTPGPKLATLRSIFSSFAFNRRMGASALAGLACGPLIAAIPMSLASVGFLHPHASGDYDTLQVYSSEPGLAAINIVFDGVLVGLLGAFAGVLSRFIRSGKAVFAILFLVGAVIMATRVPPNDMSIAVFLPAGALVFLVYHQLFFRMDMLAALMAAYCASVLFNATALLMQPARSFYVSGITALGWLAALSIGAALVAWRGSALAIEEATSADSAAKSQREALMAEFSIAHRVQQQMLPERPPEIPGFSIAASCQPAREVGGDLFDFLRLPDGRWTITVGDVSGKGVPASLYMTLTKGLLIAATQDSGDLLDIIASVNGHIHEVTERKTFVTMALGALDPQTRCFDHVRAGHNPVVLRRAENNETSFLNTPGIGLGMVSNTLFQRSTRLGRVQLNSGDVLVFYSDGLTEAMNRNEEQFGEDRLVATLEGVDGLDAAAVRERILARVSTFLDGVPPQDDMTIVVVRVN
jgi:sigma-B regulation protein RsbU (phosphoserine phosphatase)